MIYETQFQILEYELDLHGPYYFNLVRRLHKYRTVSQEIKIRHSLRR